MSHLHTAKLLLILIIQTIQCQLPCGILCYFIIYNTIFCVNWYIHCEDRHLYDWMTNKHVHGHTEGVDVVQGKLGAGQRNLERRILLEFTLKQELYA